MTPAPAAIVHRRDAKTPIDVLYPKLTGCDRRHRQRGPLAHLQTRAIHGASSPLIALPPVRPDQAALTRSAGCTNHQPRPLTGVDSDGPRQNSLRNVRCGSAANLAVAPNLLRSVGRPKPATAIHCSTVRELGQMPHQESSRQRTSRPPKPRRTHLQTVNIAHQRSPPPLETHRTRKHHRSARRKSCHSANVESQRTRQY